MPASGEGSGDSGNVQRPRVLSRPGPCADGETEKPLTEELERSGPTILSSLWLALTSKGHLFLSPHCLPG